MQQWAIYKIVIGCWMLSLATSFSVVSAAERSNPWALPQAATEQLDGEQSQKTPSTVHSSWRFVTPETLDSLKQQQIQMQLMPRRIVPVKGNAKSANSCSVQPEQTSRPNQWPPAFGVAPRSSNMGGQTAMPSGMPYGMNMNNPMFDSPAVSPWGNGADVLYRGESFPKSFPGSLPTNWGGEFPGMSSGSVPWVPNEALGGLLPIPPSQIENDYQREYPGERDDSGDKTVEKSKIDKVFNPFTFLPGDSLR
jgi:hypothetical protein